VLFVHRNADNLAIMPFAFIVRHHPMFIRLFVQTVGTSIAIALVLVFVGINVSNRQRALPVRKLEASACIQGNVCHTLKTSSSEGPAQ